MKVIQRNSCVICGENDPEIIKNSKSPLVILKVGQYFNEVKNQLLQINPNVKIVK